MSLSAYPVFSGDFKLRMLLVGVAKNINSNRPKSESRQKNKKQC